MKFFTSVFSLLFVFLLNAQTVVLSEGFDNGIPSDWTIIDGDQFPVHPSVEEFQPAWISLDDPMGTNGKIAGSTSYFEPEGKAYRLLVTPQISLGEFGNFLSWESMSHDPSFPDWIMILISTTGNQIEDFTDTLFRLNNEFPEWTSRSVSLSDSGYVSQDIYIAFVNHTNRGFKLYVDNIQVQIDNPVSTVTFESNNLVMYPNPANDFVRFQSTLPIEKIEVMDQTGRLVATEELNDMQLNISHLDRGMYFVRVFTSAGMETKVLKKE
jgi:hypothetical protein